MLRVRIYNIESEKIEVIDNVEKIISDNCFTEIHKSIDNYFLIETAQLKSVEEMPKTESKTPTIKEIKFDLEGSSFERQKDIENYLKQLYANIIVTTSQNIDNENILNICIEYDNNFLICYATCQMYSKCFEVIEVTNIVK